MNQPERDPELVSAFAPARSLTPTEAEVATVLRRVQNRRHHAWRPRLNASGVIGALGTLAALLVAVFALSLAGHKSGGSSSRSQSSSQTAAAGQAQRRAARQARQRAIAIEQALQSSARAAPALLLDLAVFDAHPPSGDARADGAEAGLRVSRPAISALPLNVVGDHLPGNPDYRQVRRVNTRSGFEFWIIPGATDACITADSQPPGGPASPYPISGNGGACAANLAQVQDTGIWQTYTPPHGLTLLYGFVPRTNRTITLTMRDRSVKTVPVIDGAFVAPAAGITQIRTKGVTGKTVTSLGPDA